MRTPVTKLEELKAAALAAYDTAMDAYWYSSGAAYDAAYADYEAASDAYWAELRKIREENSND
jgi:hypothetical protein